MQKRRWKQIAVCFPPPRGRRTCNERALRKLSLPEWAENFAMISVSRVKGLEDLAMPQLLEFAKQHYGWQRLPDLRPLAQSLQTIQRYRGGSAHYREPTSRYEQETLDLEEMRRLVLGIEQASVITQIFRLFAPRIPPNELLPDNH